MNYSTGLAIAAALKDHSDAREQAAAPRAERAARPDAAREQVGLREARAAAQGQGQRQAVSA